MDAWLLSWMPAGRNFVDRVVTILPNEYDEQDVVKVLEALFYVGSLTLDETAQMRAGAEMQPQTHRSVHANNYIRLV